MAGTNNTIGNSNTFIGSEAGKINSSGSLNVFLGSQAGYQANNIFNDVFIGYGSGYSTTSGQSNSFLGASSGYSNTTGYSNAFMGNRAGYTNTTGYSNTILGSMANVLTGALFNATAVGFGAVVNANNKIVLGNASATTVGGYGAWTNYSDYRLKENIIYKSDPGLSFIMKLRPVSFNYRDDNNKRRRDGLIAQDVQQALNDLNIDFSGLVIDDDSMKTMNLSYGEFVIPLINAVQEQQTQIESDKSEIQALKEKNKQIESQQKEIDELKTLVNRLIANQTAQVNK
jgi:hypothetical protein